MNDWTWETLPGDPEWDAALREIHQCWDPDEWGDREDFAREAQEESDAGER